MRFDHHCPWIGNCVGLLNHKIFWLFLLYSVIGLLICCITVTFNTKKYHNYDFLQMSSGALAFSTFIMLIFHSGVILLNWTTLEGPTLYDENIFSKMSYTQCWEATFGTNKFLWLIPVTSISPTAGLDYGASIPVGGVLDITDQENLLNTGLLLKTNLDN